VYGQVSRRFEVLISAEFGIKKKRTDVENSLPEIIVEKFSDVEALEFDRMRNIVTIFRKEFKPETLTASSTQEADSLITLIEGYYRLMVNQYKQLLRGSKSTGSILCHGPISRKLGEYLLLKGCKEDGSFLLRKKRSEHFNLVLSVYVGEKVMNYDIVWDTSTEPGFYHLKGSKKGFSDLSGLVEHHKLAA
ncbi:tyrosine-protein kinase JAK2-like, partial [Oculina patagonica]